MDSVESVEQRPTVAMVLRKVQGGGGSVYSRDWAESFMQETGLVKNMMVGLHTMEPVIDLTESKVEMRNMARPGDSVRDSDMVQSSLVAGNMLMLVLGRQQSSSKLVMLWV